MCECGLLEPTERGKRGRKRMIVNDVWHLVLSRFAPLLRRAVCCLLWVLGAAAASSGWRQKVRSRGREAEDGAPKRVKMCGAVFR